MRVAAGHVDGQANGVEKLRDARAAVGARHPRPMDRERLGDRLAHSHPRVERPTGVLERDADLAEHAACAASAHPVHRLAQQAEFAGCRGQQTQRELADGRFARTGFADQADELACADGEADVKNSRGVPAVHPIARGDACERDDRHPASRTRVRHRPSRHRRRRRAAVPESPRADSGCTRASAP